MVLMSKIVTGGFLFSLLIVSLGTFVQSTLNDYGKTPENIMQFNIGQNLSGYLANGTSSSQTVEVSTSLDILDITGLKGLTNTANALLGTGNIISSNIYLLAQFLNPLFGDKTIIVFSAIVLFIGAFITFAFFSLVWRNPV